MSRNSTSNFNLRTGTDLAFALVVFISFFTAFSTSSISSPFLITVIICLGIAYISNGIYGFSYVRKSKTLTIKLVYFLLQLIIGGLIIYYGKGAGFTTLILLPVVAHTAMILDQDWSIIVNIGVLLTHALSVWAFSQSLAQIWETLPIFFAGQVFILIFTQMAVTELKAREELEKLASDLSEANRHLSEYAEQVHILAVTQERNRFAREIHDGLGHYLTTINMQISASAAVARKDPQKAIYMLENAQKLISEALVDVRDSVYALRKDAADIEDLPSRIQKIAESASSVEREVSFSLVGVVRPVSPQVDLTIYRAAQEGVNNAQKHSKATKIKIVLDYSKENLIELEIKDNGVGAEKMQNGFGLLGLQERVRLLNGNAEITNNPGQGFTIRISIPG